MVGSRSPLLVTSFRTHQEKGPRRSGALSGFGPERSVDRSGSESRMMEPASAPEQVVALWMDKIVVDNSYFDDVNLRVDRF